jgi:hypothetical protein
MGSYCEIPFVSATTLDSALTSSGSGKAALQKYRQKMRRQLDPGKRLSVGRAGTLQLTSVPALVCVAIATRWNMHDALNLADMYKKEGFIHLTRSKDYKQALNLVGEALKLRLRETETKRTKTSIMEVIPRCWQELTATYKEVRNLAECMHEILTKVDREAEQMKRYAGRVVRFEGEGTLDEENQVRFEGGNALIKIDTGEREELRSVDSDYLRSAGICRNGALFVLHEYRWSPDTTMSLFFPAFDLEYDAKREKELVEKLNKYAKSLPEPPAELFPANVSREQTQTQSTGEPVREQAVTATSAPRVKVAAH